MDGIVERMPDKFKDFNIADILIIPLIIMIYRLISDASPRNFAAANVMKHWNNKSGDINCRRVNKIGD